MIRHSALPALNLSATHRVQALPQAAVNPLLDMLAAHYLTGELMDRATFLKLADEAEAVCVR